MTANTQPTEGADPVAEWMESLGFEETMLGNFSGKGEMISSYMATFFYQQMLEARDDAVKTKFSEMSVDQLHMISGVIEGFIKDKSALQQRQKGDSDVK